MDDFEKNLNKAIEAERGRSGISKKVLSRRLGWGGGANLTRINAPVRRVWLDNSRN